MLSGTVIKNRPVRDDFLFHKAVFDLDSVELFKKWLGGKIKEERR